MRVTILPVMDDFDPKADDDLPDETTQRCEICKDPMVSDDGQIWRHVAVHDHDAVGRDD